MKYSMTHSKSLRDRISRQDTVTFVIFTTDDGTVLSVDLFGDYDKASASFKRQVKEEFAKIRKELIEAFNFRESVTADSATMTWQIQDGAKLTSHFCHAELGDTSLDLV